MALERLKPEDFLVPNPTYADFPYPEYNARIKRCKELMAENKIDCLVLWKRENIRYFFGFQTTHWEIPSIQPAVGIIPLDHDPILVVPDLLQYNAQLLCWTKDLVVQRSAHEVKRTRELPREVATLIKDIGYGSKRIGLEMGDMGGMWIPRPLNDIQLFMNTLSGAEFVAGDMVVWGCRMVKSALEMERIAIACDVTAKCHSAVVEEYRPGMTEMDIGKIIHRVEVESGDLRGHDGVLTASITCNLEKEGMADILALDGVEIAKGDFMKLDLLHRHKGYWADVARVIQVGPLTDRIKRNYALCEEGLVSATNMIKPGVRACDVYAAAVQPIVDAGIKPLEMAGHGIGMDVHEPPSVDSVNDTVLQEGMVLAVEVWIYKSLRRRGGEGSFAFEEEFIVTDKGCARLSGFNRGIVQVSHPIL